MHDFDSDCFGMSLSARVEFDPDAYKAHANLTGENPDDLWKHYNRYALSKTFNPNKWFDGQWYRKQYNLNDNISPFLHFCSIGCKYGASPSEKTHKITQKKISEIFNSREKNQVTLQDKQYAFDRKNYQKNNLTLVTFPLSVEEHFVNVGIRTYEPIGEIKRKYTSKKSPHSIELYEDSFEFIETIPFTYFNAAYYSDAYSVEHNQAWEDFKTTGYNASRYPNHSTAIYEYLLLQRRGEKISPHINNQIELSIALNSETSNQSQIVGGDGTLETAYKSLFNDYFSHRAFIRRRHKIGIYENHKQLSENALKFKELNILDAHFYASQFSGVSSAQAHEHYLTFGQNLGMSHNPNFDLTHYTETYTDMVSYVHEPCIHYEQHGRNEGRLSLGEELISLSAGQKKYLKSKKTIILFTHEVSRTGAPIVALNIAKHLSKSYNIIVWSGKSGALDEAFKLHAVQYITGWGGASDFDLQITALIEKYKAEKVIINSIVCHPIIPRLAHYSLSVLSLFHEFAFYVFPHGCSSKSVTLSDHTVLPANIVANSFKDELEHFHKTNHSMDDSISVRPQGINKNSLQKSDFSRDSFIRKFKINSTKVKIVLGAGQLNKRKGQDLFVRAAKHVMDQNDQFDWRFIWVGGNFDIRADINNSLYLDYFIKQNKLQDNIFFMPHQNSLEVFYHFADIFFLSSRLDPYPNVVLDAIDANIPTIVFKGATGYDGFVAKYPKIIREVDYGDCLDAANEIIKIANEDVSFTAKIKKSIERDLSFDFYIKDIENKLTIASMHAKKRQALQDQLAKKSYRELLHIAGQMPSYLFSNPTIYGPKDYAARIASYFCKNDLDANTHKEFLYKNNICDSQYEDSEFHLNHSIICYAKTSDQLELFLEIYGPLNINFIVALEEYDANEKFSENINYLQDAYLNVPDIIARAELPSENEFVAILELNDFSLSPNDPINNIMTGLLSGKLEKFLKSNNDYDAILAQSNLSFSQTHLSPELGVFAGYFNIKKLSKFVQSEALKENFHTLKTTGFLQTFIKQNKITLSLNPWVN